MRAGWSLDLTMRDPDTNEPRDLSKKSNQNKVRKMVLEGKPFMLIGSPPCTAFTRLQALNKHKREPEVVKKELAAACEHIRFCFEMYEIQRNGCRYFAHEHPSSASSWNRPEVLDMLLKEDVELVIVDMCDFGMVSTNKYGEALVRKRTKILTNSPEVARRVARKCSGDHVHTHLMNGKAKRAQLYPRAFSKAVCEGIAAQKKLHSLGLRQSPLMNVDEMDEAVTKLTGKVGHVEMLHEDEIAMDDQSGGELDPQLVRQARRSEIEYFKDMNVYCKVPIEECWEVTGANPITTRWVDINEGGEEHPDYRSRIVAQELNTYKRDDILAGTPPLEANKILLSLAVTDSLGCHIRNPRKGA